MTEFAKIPQPLTPLYSNMSSKVFTGFSTFGKAAVSQRQLIKRTEHKLKKQYNTDKVFIIQVVLRNATKFPEYVVTTTRTNNHQNPTTIRPLIASGI
jgi:hypothetical protein